MGQRSWHRWFDYVSKIVGAGDCKGRENLPWGAGVQDVWPSVRVEWEKAPWSQGCLSRSYVDTTYGIDGQPDRNGRISIRSIDGRVLRTKP